MQADGIQRPRMCVGWQLYRYVRVLLPVVVCRVAVFFEQARGGLGSKKCRGGVLGLLAGFTVSRVLGFFKLL